MNHLSVYEAIFGLIGPDTTCRSYYFLVKNGRDNVYINWIWFPVAVDVKYQEDNRISIQVFTFFSSTTGPGLNIVVPFETFCTDYKQFSYTRFFEESLLVGYKNLQFFY